MSTTTQHAAAAPAVRPDKPGNTIGRLTGLTLFTPVRTRWLPVAKAGVLGWASSCRWPRSTSCSSTSSTTCAGPIVRKLPDGQTLKRAHLFFESNFDGPWQHYIDAFAYVIPRDIWFVWGRGLNFPAPPPAEPLKAWIAENSMEGGTYYSAYPEASTRMCKQALAVDEALADCASSRSRCRPRSSRRRGSGS